MRRTPTLTAQARDLFEQEIVETGGWTPGATVMDIACATGLTRKQVRDSIFAESADEWRRALMVKRRGGTLDASSGRAMDTPMEVAARPSAAVASVGESGRARRGGRPRAAHGAQA